MRPHLTGHVTEERLPEPTAEGFADDTAPALHVGEQTGTDEHLQLAHLIGCPENRVESWIDTDPRDGAPVHVTRCGDCGAHATAK